MRQINFKNEYKQRQVASGAPPTATQQPPRTGARRGRPPRAAAAAAAAVAAAVAAATVGEANAAGNDAHEIDLQDHDDVTVLASVYEGALVHEDDGCLAEQGYANGGMHGGDVHGDVAAAVAAAAAAAAASATLDAAAGPADRGVAF